MTATLTEHSVSGGRETDVKLELAITAHDDGTPTKPAEAAAEDSGDKAEGPWQAFEKTAGWFAVGLGALATTFTVVGATTDQVHVMTTSFPDAVKAMFLLALTAIVIVGAAWAVPKGTPFGSPGVTEAEVAEITDLEKRSRAAKLAVRRLYATRVALFVVVGGTLWWSWFSLRVTSSHFGLPVVFPVLLGVLVAAVFLPKKQTLSGALLISGLAMFVMAAGGAVHLGVNATKFGFSMSANPTVAVDGSVATVNVAVKAALLPTGGGLRVYLVDPADAANVLGSSFVAAAVDRSADTTVSFRLPSSLAAVDVRLGRCFDQPGDQWDCVAVDRARSSAIVAISTGMPTPWLSTSIAASATDGVYTISVTGKGLRDVVNITMTGPGAVQASVPPDDSGALTWTTSVRLGTRSSITVKATSGSTTATAAFRL